MLEKDKRSYCRKTQSCSMISISREKKHWQNAVICDFSASGLKFCSEDVFNINDVYWFDLSIHNFLFESKLHVQGRICRKEPDTCRKTAYAVSFENLTAEAIIQIDEILLFSKRTLTTKETYIQ